jgi:hypothetical protein
MKKVTINGLDFYFGLNSTPLQICDYLYTINHKLNLNECFSCVFNVYKNEIINICGDEDYCEIEIETIDLITF